MNGKRHDSPRRVFLLLAMLLGAMLLAPLSPTAVRATTDLTIGGWAVVAGADGDAVRLREDPGPSYPIVATYPEGTMVEVLDGPFASEEDGSLWYHVAVDGQSGFMIAEYLSPSDGGTPPVDEPPAGDPPTGDVTGTAAIVDTNGDGIRCRAAPSTSAEILHRFVEGDVVELRGDAADGWQPVLCAGQRGFVYGLYIGPIDDDSDDETGGDANSSFDVGETVVVTGTNGDGVRLRARASFDGAVIAVVREGQEVEVRAGSTGDWVAATYRGSDGFIHLDYLAPQSAGNEEGGSGDAGAGDHAMVTETLRLRDEASMSGNVLAIAAASTVVVVTGSPRHGFYPVDWDGLEGWMYADYLTWTDAPVTPRETGVGGDAGSDPGSTESQAMVSYAMNYLGYRYVWATHGPDTFDCSGFTYWVTLHTLGEDIGAGTWTQSVTGRPVAYGELQPGDLVFFQNTYTWGLSHVGIYIGNNQFIHAENEDSGVRISSLTSPYYSTRWYGARRLV